MDYGLIGGMKKYRKIRAPTKKVMKGISP